MADEIDYKLLLRKYVEHVGACEGVDFIVDHERHTMDDNADVKVEPFTDAEWDILKNIYKEDEPVEPKIRWTYFRGLSVTANVYLYSNTRKDVEKVRLTETELNWWFDTVIDGHLFIMEN